MMRKHTICHHVNSAIVMHITKGLKSKFGLGVYIKVLGFIRGGGVWWFEELKF